MCQAIKNHRGADKAVRKSMPIDEEKIEARSSDCATASGTSSSMMLRRLDSEEGNWALRMRQEGMRLAQV